MIKLDIEDYSKVGSTYSTANYVEYKKTGNKNIFEEVIDSLILEKYSDDEETKEYIKSLPLEDKRMSILSLLDTDNKLWASLRTLIKGNKVSKVDHLKEVIEMFRTYVKVAEVEKKKHGEVMSPINELVKPMVNLVPEEFWTNPNHKILDSSAGIGTFPIMCLYKLMNGLKNWEPDVDKRFKHIVENMLYYGELQARNVFLYLCALDPNDEYNLNIYWGSFLEKSFDKHMKEVWNVESFDLIIQNPPYQLQKETDKNKNSKSPKTQPLWHLFVQKSISILGKHKYMVMVHPGTWRDIDGVFKPTQDLLKSKQIIELNIFTYKSGLEMFGAKTNFDYYVLKNTENIEPTKIVCENKSVEYLEINKLRYIPGENISYINNLLSSKEDDKVKLLSDSKYHTQQGEKKGFLSKIQKKSHNLPCVYMVSFKNKPSFWYSNIDKGHFGIPKVIWGNGASGVIVDNTGEYGLTQFSRAIVDDVKNLNNIKKALESEKFIKNVMLYKDGLGHKYNNKIISMLKKDFWKDFI